MAKLTYRPLNDADFPLLCSFLETPEELALVFPKADFPLTPEFLQALCAKAKASMVVCFHGEVVGFSNLFVGEEPSICSIGHFFISPGFRHKGIGRYLLLVMTAKALISYKASEIWLSCFANNTPALMLYERAKFNPVSMKSLRKPGRAPAVLLYLRLLFQDEQPMQSTPPETLISEME